MGNILIGLAAGLVGGAVLFATFLQPAIEGFQRVAEALS